MYQKILLPTDGSKYAEKAAKHAIWIAAFSAYFEPSVGNNIFWYIGTPL